MTPLGKLVQPSVKKYSSIGRKAMAMAKGIVGD